MSSVEHIQQNIIKFYEKKNTILVKESEDWKLFNKTVISPSAGPPSSY